MKKEYNPIADKEVFLVGHFKGIDYSKETDNFDDYLSIKNRIPKEDIIKHIEKLKPLCLKCSLSYDIFTKEPLESAGFYLDGDFFFPIDFLHYLKKYDIGIPLEYEEYMAKETR